jgi:dTDP-4-dehydrorhamnose 3,5-epimerase
MKLEDITLTPLNRIKTLGGDVMHGMRNTDPGFAGFGEAYFSLVSAGAVKGWKRHTKMTMNLLVPFGRVKFVFRIAGVNNLDMFRVEEVGLDRYMRITVPPGIWFGFQGVFPGESIVLNIASIAHDPAEVERLIISDVDYSWS